MSPAPRWAIEHRNIRLLHAIATGLIGRGHHPTMPDFALVPWHTGIGWGLYMRHEEDARRLAGKAFPVRLADQHAELRCGPLWRLKAPQVKKRGRRKIRVDALTPICIRNDAGSTTYTAPTANVLRGTLEAWTPRRLGLEVREGEVTLDLIERGTQPTTLDLGGKFGVVRGWVGYVVVETNAVGEWLLRAAEHIGYGGRCAFGFGRIRVTAC